MDPWRTAWSQLLPGTGPPAPHGLVPRTARHQDFNPKPVSFGREEGRAALEPDWELTTG